MNWLEQPLSNVMLYILLAQPTKMTVKGTEMGYRNFSPAEIVHWQLPQQANIDTTRWRRVVPLQS